MQILAVNNINLNKNNTYNKISFKAKIPNFNHINLSSGYNLGNEAEFTKDNLQKILSAFKNKYLVLILSKFVKNRGKHYVPQNSIDFFTNLDDCLANVKDKKITDYVKNELKVISEESAENMDSNEVGILMKIGDLSNTVDAYNTLNGVYSRLYKPDVWCFDEIRLDPSLPKSYIDVIKNIPKRMKKFNNELTAHNMNPRKWAFYYPVKDFVNMEKYDPLANFSEIKNNEIENYIYEKYYLTSKSMPLKHGKILNDIYKKFGVKVVISNFDKSSLEELRIIKNELRYWHKYSKGTAKFPPTLIATPIHGSFVSHTAGGYVDINGNLYINNDDGPEYFSTTLRHELTHINEQKRSAFSDYTSDKNIAKLINSIIKGKEVKEDNRTKTVLDFDKCKYREEFLKAGISPEHIEYAYTNKSEFLAVIAEGDLSRCSDEFKNILLKIGLPDCLIKMPIPVNSKIKHNAEKVQRIMEQYPKAKTYNSIMEYYYRHSL